MVLGGAAPSAGSSARAPSEHRLRSHRFTAADDSEVCDNSSEVRLDLETVVEPVREICHAGDQRQLHNLIFAVVLPQLLQRALPNRRRPTSQPLSVKQGRPLLRVERRASFVEAERLDLLLGDTRPLRRSGVRAASVLTPIQQRGLQIRQLLVLRLHRPFLHH